MYNNFFLKKKLNEINQIMKKTNLHVIIQQLSFIFHLYNVGNK